MGNISQKKFVVIFFYIVVIFFCFSLSFSLDENLDENNENIFDSNKPLIENQNYHDEHEDETEKIFTLTDANSVNTDSQEDATTLYFDFTDSKLYRLEIIGSYVNIRNGPGITYAKIHLVNRGSIFQAIGKRHSWYYIQLSEDRYGWIIQSAVRLLPLHEELIKGELHKVYGMGKPIEVRAGPNISYPILEQLNGIEELGVFLESNDKRWFLISSSNGVKGWIPAEKVKKLNKKIDLYAFQEKIHTIIDEISTYYNYKKSQQSKFQEMGWFPSISLINGTRDIQIDIIDERIRVSLTFFLRKMDNRNFFPLLEETDSFLLPNVNRHFFYIVAKSLFQLKPCYEIEIKINGLKMNEKKKNLEWAEIGKTTINKDKFPIKNIEKITQETLWKYARGRGELAFR
ncbi:MAG: SH3 domain-containing protein [bacterium]